MGYSMKTMYSGTAGAGSHPTAGINSDGTIITAWASTSSDNLYVKVGQTSTDLRSVTWGEQQKYDSGDSCAVAINGNKIAVGVHQSNGGSLYWKVGVVGTDANGLPNVTWKNSSKFTGGSEAKIAVNDSGTVVIVWSSTNNTNLYCIVGQIDMQTYQLILGDSIQYDGGLHPTVNINNNNDVIFGHASSNSTNLYYQLATAGIGTDGKYTLTSRMPGQKYDNGDQNCLALDNKGLVWEIHRSSESNSLYFAAAQLLSDLTLSPVNLSRCQEDLPEKSSIAWINMPGNDDPQTFGVMASLAEGTSNDVKIKIWHIFGIPSVSFTEITPPTGYTASLFGGMLGTDNVGTYVPGTDLGDFDGYPEGAIYFLGVPGIGTASINVRPTDSGQYTVFINADDSNALLCDSQTQLNISIDSAGVVTISDSTGKLTGELIQTMMDSGNLLQSMTTMVSNSPTLQSQWSVNAMNTLYTMGLSPTIMTNMMSVCTYTPDCCTQLAGALQSVQFGISSVTAQSKMLQGANDTWACWACQTAVWAAVNVAIVISAAYIVPALEAAVDTAVIINTIVGQNFLADCILALNSVVSGVTENQLATAIVSVISINGFEGALENVAASICSQLGACG